MRCWAYLAHTIGSPMATRALLEVGLSPGSRGMSMIFFGRKNWQS